MIYQQTDAHPRELTIMVCLEGGYIVYDYPVNYEGRAHSGQYPLFAGNLEDCLAYMKQRLLSTKEQENAGK